jgi:hypothetical protein
MLISSLCADHVAQAGAPRKRIYSSASQLKATATMH